MALPFYNWSQTAANNATADSTINWAEGQAPSTLNDSARAMMASTAAFRDDIAGAITTAGTSTAYTVTSFEVFDTLAHLNSKVIGFVPHTTSGATVTLNVDGLGAKPLRFGPSVELPAGTLVQGTPYIATYNNVDGAFYLQNSLGNNPYYVPIGAGLDWWGGSVPNSNFAFPTGQAISRTTYATLFSIFSTTYGAGDGSTTFNLPDKTGRISAMKEASATRLTSTYFGGNSTNLGATGGTESHTLTTGEMPVHNHGVTDPQHTHGVVGGTVGGATSGVYTNTGAATLPSSASNIVISSAATGITINNAGSGNPHAIVQPTIICNYIIRII